MRKRLEQAERDCDLTLSKLEQTALSRDEAHARAEAAEQELLALRKQREELAALARVVEQQRDALARGTAADPGPSPSQAESAAALEAARNRVAELERERGQIAALALESSSALERARADLAKASAERAQATLQTQDLEAALASARADTATLREEAERLRALLGDGAQGSAGATGALTAVVAELPEAVSAPPDDPSGERR